MKIKTCIICIFIALLTALYCLSGCFLLSISDKERAEIFSYYSNDDNYLEVTGILINNYLGRDGNTGWFIMFDEEFVSQNEKICKRFPINNPCGAGGKIVSNSQNILIDNGFYDLLIDPDYSNIYPETKPLIEEQITIITCPKIWWDGWDPPIVAVKVGDTVYLDFETGKANFLDWIQNDLR